MEDTIEQVDSTIEDVSSESLGTSEETQEQVEQQEQPQQAQTRDTVIEVDGRQYNVTESTLRKYNNIPPIRNCQTESIKRCYPHINKLFTTTTQPGKQKTNKRKFKSSLNRFRKIQKKR